MANPERPSGMRATLLLAALLLLFISVYEYGRVLHLRPQPMHLWRQSDCLALTLNYARGHGTFLEPEILDRIADGGATGKSAGELPLIYWGMGKLWAVTGPSEFLYRLFTMLLHLAGTFALFGFVRRVTGNAAWSIVTALLFFTSPVVVYYGIAFLTDVPAFDLTLIGWYLLARFARARHHRYWFAAVACMGLATLLKVTAGMSLVALAALLAVATVRAHWLGRERRLLPDLLPGWAAIVVVTGCVLAWYVHAEVYNDAHGGRYTFNNLWPIWTMSPAEVKEAWRFASDVLVFQVFDTSIWAVLAFALVVLLVHARQVPRALWMLLALLLIGAVSYVLLWFHALLYHDYYFINPMVAPLALWVIFLWWLVRYKPALAASRWVLVGAAALVGYNLAYAANNMHMRYHEGEIGADLLLPVYHEQELTYWSGINLGPLRDLPTIAPFLDAQGVGQEDLVIFLDDASINSSLYLMGRPGFTGFSQQLDSADTYPRLIGHGARYLLCADPLWERKAVVRPYLRRPMARYGSTRLYDLRGLDDLVPQRDTIGVEQLIRQADRCDTTSSAGGVLELRGALLPLRIDLGRFPQLAAMGGELHVLGRALRDTVTSDGPMVVYEEPGPDGLLVHHALPLGKGPVLMDIAVMPAAPGAPRILKLENRTGLPFAVQDLTVVVTTWRPGGKAEGVAKNADLRQAP